MNLGLSAAFRQQTRALHTQAEKSGIVHDLLVGTMTRSGYALLMRNLLPVYEAMEEALECRRASPGFQNIANTSVYRAASIRADLSAICGAGWSDAVPLLGAGRRYAERIATIAAGDGFGLIAHAYARYLGDLNGGQILKRLLNRSLGLKSEALTFYDFPGIADLDSFKKDYRAGIDAAAHFIAEPKPVIEEAAAAFNFNIQLSEAVKAAVSHENPAVSDASDSPIPRLDRA